MDSWFESWRLTMTVYSVTTDVQGTLAAISAGLGIIKASQTCGIKDLCLDEMDKTAARMVSLLN